VPNRSTKKYFINPLNAELNPTCHLLALLGAHHIFHVNRIRVKNSFSLSPVADRRAVGHIEGNGE